VGAHNEESGLLAAHDNIPEVGGDLCHPRALTGHQDVHRAVGKQHRVRLLVDVLYKKDHTTKHTHVRLVTVRGEKKGAR
jgi:hypothetical protein